MPLPKSVVCTACKHTYPEGWKRCPYCGFDPVQARRNAEAQARAAALRRVQTASRPQQRGRRGDRETGKRGEGRGREVVAQSASRPVAQPDRGPRRGRPSGQSPRDQRKIVDRRHHARRQPPAVNQQPQLPTPATPQQAQPSGGEPGGQPRRRRRFRRRRRRGGGPPPTPPTQN